MPDERGICRMDEYRVMRMILGPVMTNCYLIKMETSDRIVVIDPAADPVRIINAADKMNGRVSAVLLTHGHFDHIGAVEGLRESTGAKVYAHEMERSVLKEPMQNLSWQDKDELRIKADVWLNDGMTIEEGEMEFQVLYTPGHTQGGCCYYLQDEALLFSGDTLFDHSVGRTDFPTGSMSTLVRSIRDKLFVLPDETRVLPGHGEPTLIGTEKKENPFAGMYAGQWME